MLLRAAQDKVLASPQLTHKPEVGFAAHVLTHAPLGALGRHSYLQLLAVQLGCIEIDSLRDSPLLVVRSWGRASRVYGRPQPEDPFVATPLHQCVVHTPGSVSEVVLAAIQAKHFVDMHLNGVWDSTGLVCSDSDLDAVECALRCLFQILGTEFEAQFCRLIRRVLVSREISGGARHSFNLRLAYPGVLFIDPAGRPALLIAEDLLHEFMHQVLWLNSEVSGEAPRPSDWNIPVVSPFTQRTRPLPVMAHAALIYTAAGLLLESQMDSSLWSPRCAARLYAIIRHLPELRRRLQECQDASPAVEALLKVMENQHAFQ